MQSMKDRTLNDAIKNADVFLGLSLKDFNKDMVKKMAESIYLHVQTVQKSHQKKLKKLEMMRLLQLEDLIILIK